MAGAITIQGQITSVPIGTVTVGPYNLTPTTSNNYQAISITLASGTNTITVPTWAVGMIITPSSANVQTLIFKGVSGDAGVAMSPTQPFLMTFPATPPTTFVLTAGGLFITNTEITFF